MVAIPLGLEAYSRSAAFFPEVEMVNMYVEKDADGISPDGMLRLQRPGLTLNNTLDSSVNGVFQQDGVFGGSLFASSGTSLYRDGLSIVGMAATSRVAYAANITMLAVAADGLMYAYDGGPVANVVSLPNGAAVIDIDQLNGYIIAGTPTGRFYWIVPGDTSIDALNFANSESLTDGLVAVRRLGDEMWFFGSRSVEPWQATGDQDAPFERANGRQFDRGCLARDTVQRFDNSLVWVGENFVVYRASNVPTRISNDGIEERIRKRSGAPSAWVYGLGDGHLFYVLTIPGQGTFAFDAKTEKWGEWASEGFDVFRGRVGIDTPGGTFIGDQSSGVIWRMDPDAGTDDGIMIRRRLTATVALQGRPARQDSFSVAVGASGNTTAKVRWRDGQDDYPAFFEEVEIRAPYDVGNIYRLGIPDQPLRTFQIEFEGPERVSVAGAKLNEAWQ